MNTTSEANNILGNIADREIEKVLLQLPAVSDERLLTLAKEVALLAYNEQQRRSEVAEQRSFALMQFAKVGLTIIFGIASVVGAVHIDDIPLRESMMFLLAVAAIYLAKCFYRGSKVMRVGTFFKPHLDTHYKPDQVDIYSALKQENYDTALRKHIATMIWYLDHTAADNIERIYQCKCCYVNTFGFLIAFFLFFILTFIVLFVPGLRLHFPGHVPLGILMMVTSLATDELMSFVPNGWLSRPETEKTPRPS